MIINLPHLNIIKVQWRVNLASLFVRKDKSFHWFRGIRVNTSCPHCKAQGVSSKL